jgi:excisionase family DNA binding protein
MKSEVKTSIATADTDTASSKLSIVHTTADAFNADDPPTYKSNATGLPQPPATVDSDRFLTTDELAARLRCSVGTIQNWRRKNMLPWIASPGRLVLFSWPDVREAMRRRQRGGQ